MHSTELKSREITAPETLTPKRALLSSNCLEHKAGCSSLGKATQHVCIEEALGLPLLNATSPIYSVLSFSSLN